MTAKSKIAWERWDEDLLHEEIIDNLSIDMEDTDEELADEAMELMSKIPKLISTPLGIFQLYDKMSPMKQFECWMGYTNCNITGQVQKDIENVEGVELLSIISRYRFFIGVGKLFNFKTVRIDVENLLNCNDKTSEKGRSESISDAYEALADAVFETETDQINPDDSITTEETVEIIKEIISQDKYWAIFIDGNGEIDYTSSNQENDITYLEKLLSYKKLRRKNGGIILHPDNEN